MDFVRSFWDIIWEVLGWFQVITFIDEWEEGVVLQAGKFRRVVKAGWWLHCPLEIDEFHTMNIRPTAMELAEQSLTTRDDVEIVCRGVLIWSIFDIKKAILDVEDASDSLNDIAVGIIQDQVEQQDWEYIRSPEFRKDVKKAIQRQARVWGISVKTFKFQDLVKAPSYRVFGGLASE